MKTSSKTHRFLCIGLLIGALLTLTTGEVPWSKVWEGILSRLGNTSAQWNPLLDERLPRLIVILCTGASLAVSGAVMQALFQNPLASPSILGISCGGSLSVVIIFILGLSSYPYTISLAAITGCFSALLIIYTLARSSGLNSLILAGIALSTLLLAIQGALLYSLRDQWHLVQALTEWEAGSTFDRSWMHVHMQLPLTIVGLWGCFYYRKELDILALGEEEAINLGVEVNTVRWRLLACIALLTGGAVAAVGIIAFFGLVLPHMARSLQGPSNQRIIPFCALAGPAALLFLDLAVRLFDIRLFSIGNISAILGGIFFLMLLLKPERREIYT